MSRKYANTSDMLKELGADEQLRQDVQERSAATQLTRLLFALRCKAGMTQGELAEKAGCAQSVISRIENASDKDLSIGDLLRYVQALDLQLSVGFHNRRETLAERFQFHLHSLTKCAHELLDIAGDDVQILQGASDMLCNSAQHFEEVLEQSADKLSAAVEKKTGDAPQNETPLVIATPENREDCQAPKEHA